MVYSCQEFSSRKLKTETDLCRNNIGWRFAYILTLIFTFYITYWISTETNFKVLVFFINEILHGSVLGVWLVLPFDLFTSDNNSTDSKVYGF